MTRVLRAATVVAALAVVGCGSKLQPAGGKVLVDGVPVGEGTIMFYPVAGGRPATGRIVEGGAFVLNYEKPGDGLPPGDYKVVIVADIFKEFKTKSRAQLEEEAAMKRNGVTDISSMANGELIHVVPPEYNHIQTTPLTQKVERASEVQNFVYDIPSKKKK